MLAILFDLVPTLIFTVITVVMVLGDPRRMRCAVFFMLTLTSAAMGLSGPMLTWMDSLFPSDFPYALVSILLLALLLVVAVAFFMIATGVVLIHREGFGLSHSLSLLVGVGMLVYLGAFTGSVVANSAGVFAFLLIAGVPVFVFSFALVAYLLYSALLGLVVRRWGKPGQVVVVLGSGLIGDRLPPLLARRVDLGVETFEKARTKWADPVLVMSGGKGDDELRAEGAAMLEYARANGLDVQSLVSSGSEVIVEPNSASTRQNLQFSRELVEAARRNGPWTVVTSDFHAFRAANLMSRMGISGDAIGARTTPYFWISAKLREFIAMLVDSKWTTMVVLMVSLLPLLTYAISMLRTLF